MARPKLIFITHILPYPIDMGSKIRMFNLIKSLAQKYDVTLVSQVFSKNDIEYAEAFNDYCKDIHITVAENKKNIFLRLLYKFKYIFCAVFYNTPKDLFYANYCGLKKIAMRLLQNNAYDVCFFEYWYWPELVAKAPGLKVVDTNDVQYLRLAQLIGSKRKYYWYLSGKNITTYKDHELKTLNKYDIVITVTDKDKNILQGALNNKDIITVPTGVNMSYFAPSSAESTFENIISFYGAMGGESNIEAFIYFYKDILPLIRRDIPDAKVIVVGANPSHEVINIANNDNTIIVTGYVKDVREYIKKSKVSVCPMLAGYGIRGRVLEIMSMGIPVVVTPLAVDGMGLLEGHGILIRKSHTDFAQAVVKLIKAPVLAYEIGKLGHEYITKYYSYEVTYERLTDLLHIRSSF